jgi:hypothetical protein
MQLIETKTLGADAASIEFTSIPQDFTDLVVLISARNSSTSNFFRIEINGSSSNFTERALTSTGSAASSSTGSAGPFGRMSISTNTANTFGNTQFYLPNYAGATNKSISVDAVSENNATEALMTLLAGLWSQTAAITSVLFRTGANDFVAGSTFSLYGITKGSDGIVTTS